MGGVLWEGKGKFEGFQEGKMKILISEDDSVSRLLLSATLKKLGHDVIETKDGKEASGGVSKGIFPGAHL